MKTTFKLFAALFLFTLLVSMSTQKPQRIIFFGDSITEAGVKPGGYITLMQEDLKKQGRASNFELIGAGIGGNKVYDLFLRLEKDVLLKRPDKVVIYIGVNDVWHKQLAGTGTDPDKFKLFYSTIIEKIQATGAKVILCTPAVIGEKTDHSNQQDGDLNAYSSIIRSLAGQYKAQLVDLRKLFLDYNLKNNLENKESGILTTDRVHLNERGNTLVAQELAKVLF
jgi:isoamyl acetate esterase